MGVQENIRTPGCFFGANPVLAGIDAGCIVHQVIGDRQARHISPPREVSGHGNHAGRVFSSGGNRIGHNAAGVAVVPVAGHRHDVVLFQVVHSQRSHPAEAFLADTGACRHRHNIGVHICHAFRFVCRYYFVIGNIGIKSIGNIANCYSRSRRHALPFRRLQRHIDNRAAGSHVQLFPGIRTQVARSGGVHFTVLQVRNVPVFRFSVCVSCRDILIGHRHGTGSFNFLRSRDKAPVGILQFRIGKRSGGFKAAVRTAEPQAHRRIHLCEGVFPGHLQAAQTGIGTA